MCDIAVKKLTKLRSVDRLLLVMKSGRLLVVKMVYLGVTSDAMSG